MMRFVGPLLSLLLIASIFNAAEPLVFAGEAAAAGDVASTTTGQRTAERRRSDGQVRVRRGYDDPRHLSQRRLRALAGSGATKAGRGGAGPVRIGQAGENAVRGAYDIGEKVPIRVAGRGRIPDGLTPSTLSEVKNVGALSYTRQLRDYVDFAQQSNRRVDLFVRGGSSPTNLSGPLREALSDPSVPIRLRRIP